MAENKPLVWDADSTRLYETGVSKGVFYSRAEDGTYKDGEAWNGLTGVTESPSGAEATALWADNMKYLNLRSAEEFGATVTAYTYPDGFAKADGSAELVKGVTIGQQTRTTFGMSYQTVVGNDVKGQDYGYKIHLIYGCEATPSERAYATINDSPEAIEFSWELSTTPVTVAGMKPTACIIIDSTKCDKDKLAEFEKILYGSEEAAARMPLPDEVKEKLTPSEAV